MFSDIEIHGNNVRGLGKSRRKPELPLYGELASCGCRWSPVVIIALDNHRPPQYLVHVQIEGVILTPLTPITDPRGWLLEVWRQDETGHCPAMGYVSLTKPGVVRGPHEHQKQADWFVFLPGPDWAITLWDNREQSPTFGVREGFIIDEPSSLLVPVGVVHAYENTSIDTNGLVLNLPDRLYAGWNRAEQVDEIRYEESGKFKL